MQELNVQPSIPTPYTPAGGTYNNNPIPGAGGLPALSGLNNRINPMAQELQSQGRGEDKMLVHMTPDEVNSLQGLAMYSGTTMTINPNTGLPEAGLLGKIFKKLIPTLLGGALAATGVGAPLAAGIVGLGSTALTGSLKKGLMAGLGAFGGASLAGAAGLGGSVSKNAFGVLGDKAGIFGANMGAGASTAGLIGEEAGSLAAQGLKSLPQNISGISSGAQQAVASAGLPTGAFSAANPGLLARFGQTASRGLPGIIGKSAPMLAASGVLGSVSGAAAAAKKPGKGPEPEKTWAYEGPYLPQERVYDPQATGFEGEGETMFFRNPNPFPGYRTATGGVPTELQSQFPMGYADGGSTSDEKPQETMVPASGSTPKGLTLTGVPTTPTFNDPAKPITERKTMIEYAGDEGAAKAMTTGFVDSQGRRSQFSGTSAATMKPGTIQDFSAFGGPSLKLGDDLRWYTTEPLKAPTPMTTDTTKTTVTDTSTPTRNTETAKTTTTVANPQAGQSGYGVKALPNMYVPQYTSKDDFVTEKAAPYELGGQLASQMPEFIDMYRTSPGAVTSSLQYPGGSFNEQFKARLAARPKTPTPLETFFANYYAQYGAPPTGYGDIAPSDMSYAKGGIHMDDGSFVVDARTVSELGNGSSNAGIEFLERLGGRAVRGPGDGVSDSVPAKIGGTQEARVARDEVVFPAKAVKRLGGAKKLYALMDKAHKARKKAGRGDDTKLRMGLGAL